MNDVMITGVGMTPVREHWALGLRELAAEAVGAALADAGEERVDSLIVGSMTAGTLGMQAQLGPLVAGHLGLDGIEAVQVDAGEASGAAALRQAVLAVRSGAARVAVALGVDKLTELSGYQTNAALSTTTDAEYEAQLGLTPAALSALLMRRYMHLTGSSLESFAAFSVNSHANGRHNPAALFRFPITVEKYLRAGMVADPINLFDSAPICDGAAAVVVTAAGAGTRTRGVRVLASESAGDHLALHGRRDPLRFEAVTRATERALERAERRHDQMDLCEVHDPFSIVSALTLEAAGFAERGHGAREAAAGAFAIDGRLPIATFGGMKARGGPGGATGLYQVVEAVLQLRQEAPAPIQVADATTAMTVSLGGIGATAVTTILERAAL